MASGSGLSPSDVLFSEETDHDDVYSPPSTYSTYSQEVKYIFEPQRTSSTNNQDYSYIPYRPEHRKHGPALGTLALTSHAGLKPHECRPQTSSYRIPPTYTISEEKTRTWSPPPLRMGVSSSLPGIRTYNSNDHLENEDFRRKLVREDLDDGPPKIAPVSGMLTQSPGKGLIRPIAFKPVIPNKYVNPVRAQQERKSSSQDDGYGSQDYNMTSQGSNNTSLQGDSFSSDYNKRSDRPDSLPSSSLSHLSSNHIECYVQTPSPSDSGVGELEAMLKEKETEINLLREVMDRNERAIFQVHEEQKNKWYLEAKEIREDCERKIKLQQRRACKSEQMLSLQLYKLQQEKKSLKGDYDKLLEEKNELARRCSKLDKEGQHLQSEVEQVSWDLHVKHEECAQMKSKLTENKDKLTKKSEELKTLKSQVRNKQVDMEKKNDHLGKFKDINSRIDELNMQRSASSLHGVEMVVDVCEAASQTDNSLDSPEFSCELLKPSLISEKDKQVSLLQSELKQAKEQQEVWEENLERERDQWLEEKTKVIRYQKQLQLNYVQMFRKNRMLEAEVEQLTLELENRDMKLLALNGGEESVC